MVSVSKPSTGSTAEKCRAEHNDLCVKFLGTSPILPFFKSFLVFPGGSSCVAWCTIHTLGI